MTDLIRKMERAAADRAMRKDANLRARAPSRYLRHSAQWKGEQAEAERLMRSLPEDTRTPAQRLLGDPIPNDPRRGAR